MVLILYTMNISFKDPHNKAKREKIRSTVPEASLPSHSLVYQTAKVTLYTEDAESG